MLSVGQADGDYHPPASLELVDKGSWDEIGRGCDNHLDEGGMLGPAQIAVRYADFDISVALPFEQLHRPLRQLLDDFDTVYPAG